MSKFDRIITTMETAMDSTTSVIAQLIGNALVGQYYTVLHESPGVKQHSIYARNLKSGVECEDCSNNRGI
ncbi:uncharacterized protein DS421_14g487720 [Arachis hypogaea]|nr:uncharacterized protein DS421_14g487720 [Arachis hypogaea]